MTKKILFLLSVSEKGGAEIVILNIIQHIDKQKFSPIVVSLNSGDGRLVNEIRDMGVEVLAFPFRSLRFLPVTFLRVLKLAIFLKKNNIDLVFANGAHNHIYGRLAALLARKKTIWYVMAILSPKIMQNGLIGSLALLLNADIYIGDSDAVTESIRRIYPSCNSHTVHHGIDINRFNEKNIRHDIRKEFGISPDVPLISIIGRLQPWKGQDYFIKAAQIVSKELPEARYLIAGGALFGMDLDYPEYLQCLANEIGLADKIIFTGFREDVPEIIAASDVIVHASVEPEPFGLVIIEGMAMGKPVIATDAGGPREIIENGKTGILVPMRDSEAIAHAVLLLLRDDELRKKIGIAARKRVEAMFTAEKMTRQIEKIVEDCLSR
jgi:glycosyltransferase involved in cell wall biosynthesis